MTKEMRDLQRMEDLWAIGQPKSPRWPVRYRYLSERMSGGFLQITPPAGVTVVSEAVTVGSPDLLGAGERFAGDEERVGDLGDASRLAISFGWLDGATD